jgi:hypothetical protein
MMRKLGLRTRVMNSRQMMNPIFSIGRVTSEDGRCPPVLGHFRGIPAAFPSRLTTDEDVVHARNFLVDALYLHRRQ